MPVVSVDITGEAPLEDSFGLFLVQCVIILTICRVLGLAGSYFKLPKVIFEIVGMLFFLFHRASATLLPSPLIHVPTIMFL